MSDEMFILRNQAIQFKTLELPLVKLSMPSEDKKVNV